MSGEETIKFGRPQLEKPCIYLSCQVPSTTPDRSQAMNWYICHTHSIVIDTVLCLEELLMFDFVTSPVVATVKNSVLASHRVSLPLLGLLTGPG